MANWESQTHANFDLPSANLYNYQIKPDFDVPIDREYFTGGVNLPAKDDKYGLDTTPRVERLKLYKDLFDGDFSDIGLQD